MGFIELVKKRRSVRGYLDKAVEREKIEYCLEAARLAPSACNSQPWHFVVVDEPGLREKVAKATFGKMFSFNHFSMQAPVLAAIVSAKQTMFARFGQAVKRKDFHSMDVGIAAEHFCLAAAETGLGTCMLGWFDEAEVKKLLGVPKNKRVELIITLGYAKDEEIKDKNRKEPEEMRSYNKYR